MRKKKESETQSYVLGRALSEVDVSNYDDALRKAAKLAGDGATVESFRVLDDGISVVVSVNGSFKKIFIARE